MSFWSFCYFKFRWNFRSLFLSSYTSRNGVEKEKEDKHLVYVPYRLVLIVLMYLSLLGRCYFCLYVPYQQNVFLKMKFLIPFVYIRTFHEKTNDKTGHKRWYHFGIMLRRENLRKNIMNSTYLLYTQVFLFIMKKIYNNIE